MSITISVSNEIHCGVLQGCVGPHHTLEHASPQHSININNYPYADDTLLFSSIKCNFNCLHSLLNRPLDIMSFPTICQNKAKTALYNAGCLHMIHSKHSRDGQYGEKLHIMIFLTKYLNNDIATML